MQVHPIYTTGVSCRNEMQGTFQVLSPSRRPQSFRQPLHIIPLGAVKKTHVDNSSWRLIRCLSKQDVNGNYTNSWINFDQWETKWGSASMVADFVSCVSQIFPSLHFSASMATFSSCVLPARGCVALPSWYEPIISFIVSTCHEFILPLEAMWPFSDC